MWQTASRRTLEPSSIGMTKSHRALADQEFMDALLNLILPASTAGSLPGAGTLGLSGAVSAAIQGDPLLGPLVEAGAEAIWEAAFAQNSEGLPGMTQEAGTKLLETQVATYPVLIMGISRHLYPLYYQQPSVLEGIGAEARPPFPKGFEVEPTDAELLRSRKRR